MEGIGANTTLENSYNLMQSFIKAIEDGDTQKIESLIASKDSIEALMHKTLLTFKHNLKAVLNGAALTYSNGCLEGFNRKIKQIERTAFGYSNFINLLTRIRLEENLFREKEPNSLLMAAWFYSFTLYQQDLTKSLKIPCFLRQLINKSVYP